VQAVAVAATGMAAFEYMSEYVYIYISIGVQAVAVAATDMAALE